MKQFPLLIKPTSSECNSDCLYCFYKNLSLYRENKLKRMSEETLRTLVEKYLKTEQAQYVFSWQGGEPLLMGLEFYKKVISFQVEFARQGSVIGNGIQSNGYLINDSWADFFSQAKFLVGISVDGPEELHNKFRIAPDGTNSFSLVMNAIKLLHKHNVTFNALTVVSSASAGKAKQIYQFLKGIGSDYHQYIPCVEYARGATRLPWTIDGKQWGHFLCDLFEIWINDSNRASIRLFDSIILVLLGRNPGICQMGTSCCQYFVIEHNGDVFPCDFFVRDSTLLGNIMSNDWQDFFDSKIYKNFGIKKSLWHPDCDRCQFVKFCAGDCQKHRISKIHLQKEKSVLCEGWKIFYKKTIPEFKKIANYLRSSAELQI
ncbi:MAG: anaerobic sulfatase maturase [Candidatus Omnitrophica bacterium]|nr:anaerobic sulfatase maturase [Candidatus Omnitrophota bacterium]MCM8825111.1 anaerobic sulfatase maturase [Candidatus Omnitrophota bacterium]